MLDLTRFPGAARYLGGLPHGLSSYPECKVKSVFVLGAMKDFPEVFADPKLPKPLTDLLARATDPNEWLPDVVAVLVRLMLRDRALASDANYLAWNYTASVRLFDSALFRMVMHVMSPTLVMMGAGRRWSTFRTGTIFEPQKNNGRWESTLLYPPRLYPKLVLEGFADTFRSGLEATRTPGVRVDLLSHDETRALYRAQWG
jgi:hypothetical protein